MDKMKIIHWFQRNIIPSHSLALKKMGWEVDKKIGNYLRGRALEFLIVTVVTTITFWIFHLQYAFLLAVLVGISVFIPYIGIIIATLPAFALAIIQFGFSDKLLYLSIAYSAIVLLDANVLVPLLFSEAVDLHPTVIILSVLLFGGLWQFWGMFFAIPLAILIAAIFKHWPTASVNDY
jgi:putative permease